jgi:hypothetical protein
MIARNQNRRIECHYSRPAPFVPPSLVFGGLMPLGGLESGALAQTVGVPWTIAGGALVCAGVGVVIWRTGRR